eukprot:m.693544 g.693544  ORF g.693544 m.693544 type:complete len:390 (+) comp22873_c0_seq13:170-1339(+)
MTSEEGSHVVGENVFQVGIRLQCCVLRIDDLQQSCKVDITAFYHYRRDADANRTHSPNSKINGPRIRRLRDSKAWRPRVNFLNVLDQTVLLEDTLFEDTSTGTRFGVLNWVVVLDEKLELQRFPFDRQIFTVTSEWIDAELVPWDSNELPPSTFPESDETVEIVSISESALWKLCRGKVESEFLSNDGQSRLEIELFMERYSSYYIWNFVVVLFTLVVAAPTDIVISLDDVQDRFAFIVALVLTAVAFKFVTSTMVPKTAYLTYLDKYTLVAYGFLISILFKDYLLAHLYQRGHLSVDSRDNGDTIYTIAYVAVWLLLNAVLFIGAFTGAFRESWEQKEESNLPGDESFLTKESIQFTTTSSSHGDDFGVDRSQDGNGVSRTNAVEDHF